MHITFFFLFSYTLAGLPPESDHGRTSLRFHHPITFGQRIEQRRDATRALTEPKTGEMAPEGTP